MALHYTKPLDEQTSKDVPADEFIKKMVESKRVPEERQQVFNTETNK